jgi:DNA-binding SARP family transcriptional activator/tetratricopeptide (TPR) repeat protein
MRSGRVATAPSQRPHRDSSATPGAPTDLRHSACDEIARDQLKRREYRVDVRVLVLGRTEVASADGSFRPVPGRRNQQLLALYALDVGRPVADDVAFEALWGETWPSDPGGSLRAYVTRLRRVLGDDGAVVRAQRGYRLVMDPADIDVAVFEQNVSAGRVAGREGDIPGCLRQLHAALDLWRGPPWGALTGWPPADADAVRCEELHASAEELVAESSIRLGHHAEAIEQLTALCERDPFRERHWELLMVALYLSGRQGDALRAYQRARDVLIRELGIEPSAGLRRLETDVLQQRVEGWSEPMLRRPELEPHTGRDRRPARAPSGLIGRGRESATFDEQLEQVFAGEARVAVVSGEAGIGKTRMLEAFKARAIDRGARVHWGESYEAEATGAYRPVATLVRSIIGNAGAHASAALARDRGQLAILIPELAESPDREDAANVVGDRQWRLFDSVSNLVRSAASDHPLVLVFDDAHWADPESLRLLAHVLRHIGAAWLLVVVAYRPEEVGLDHPLRSILSEVRRSGSLCEVTLGRLSDTDVGALMETVIGRAVAPRVAQAVATVSGGNPLFIAELSKTLRPDESLTWSLNQVHGRLPVQIEEVLSRRVSLVGPLSRETLTVIAAAPGGCEASTLAQVLDTETGSILDAIDELLDAGLIVERREGQDAAYATTHDLYGYAAFDALSRARQVNLHYRLALALDAGVDSNRERHLAPAAYHWHAAGRSGDPSRALRRCEAAGDLALERTAYADAIAHFSRALEAIEWSGGDDLARARLLIKRAEANHRAGNPLWREADAEAAAGIAESMIDGVTLAHAALVHGGLRSTYGVTNTRTTALLGRAYDSVSDDALRVRVGARLAQELYHGGDYETARQLSGECVELARQIGDDEILAAAFHGRAWTLNHPDWLGERTALADEMIGRAMAARNREWEMAGRIWRAAALLEAGYVDELETELEVLGRLETVVLVPSDQVRVATLRAALAMMQGDFDRGIELAQRAHAIGSVAEPANADQVLQAQMITPMRERGQLAAVVPLVEDLAQQYADAPGWLCAAAFVFCEANQVERARDILESLAADGFTTVPRDLAWMQAIAYLAEVAAVVGDVTHAATLYELMAPYAGRNVGLWDIASGGAVAHFLGILAARTGNRELAMRHLREAIEFNRRTGQVPAELWSRLRLAELLLDAGQHDDATTLARHVRTVARGRGFTALDEAADGLANGRSSRGPLPTTTDA